MKKLWEKDWTPWKTESAYFSWIRGGLRKLWSRHPVKSAAKMSKRKKLPNKKGREVWHCQCASCKVWLPQAEIQVDHIKPAGSLKTFKELGAFAERLLNVDIKDVQLLCKECHKDKSYFERYGKKRKVK